MNTLFILLDAAAATGGKTPNPMSSFIWIILLFAIMWLVMIRPQSKQRKQEEKMRKELKKGDRVVFSGGIFGKVHAVGDDTVEVEVSNGVILTVEKSYIQATANPNEEGKKK